MFWKHPITKKNRFLSVVHATNGIPSYFDHFLSKTSRSYPVRAQPSVESLHLAPWPLSSLLNLILVPGYLNLGTVFLATTKSRSLELLAFDEYCRFDTSAWD
jgi:hypothetical protein